MILEKEDIQLVADMTGLSCANAKDYIDKIYKDLEDDQVTFDDILDVVECEIKVKENNIKNVVQSDKKKVSKPKTVVVSDEKIALFNVLLSAVKQNYGENAQIVKENKEICVQIDGKSFKIDLVQHRDKKK